MITTAGWWIMILLFSGCAFGAVMFFTDHKMDHTATGEVENDLQRTYLGLAVFVTAFVGLLKIATDYKKTKTISAIPYIPLVLIAFACFVFLVIVWLDSMVKDHDIFVYNYTRQSSKSTIYEIVLAFIVIISAVSAPVAMATRRPGPVYW